MHVIFYLENKNCLKITVTKLQNCANFVLSQNNSQSYVVQGMKLISLIKPKCDEFFCTPNCHRNNLTNKMRKTNDNLVLIFGFKIYISREFLGKFIGYSKADPKDIVLFNFMEHKKRKKS